MVEPGEGGVRSPRFWQISYVTLSQPRGADYAPHITTRPYRFSVLNHMCESDLIWTDRSKFDAEKQILF